MHQILLSAGNIVAVDSVSPTVFVISEAGDLIKWFDCSDYMREPSDIAVSNKEYFVCDFKVSVDGFLLCKWWKLGPVSYEFLNI